ncbi:hypothetical protein JKF63_05583 [Porcisia hertigi]|uniref:Helicase-like protein n=1 Tax=Porcisia hertigi TaxID=2761500 RepID=A0A836I1Z0_9TRYP|nr:hypothetical protein JKF63_05583 [Porcisia hertigi]
MADGSKEVFFIASSSSSSDEEEDSPPSTCNTLPPYHASASAYGDRRRRLCDLNTAASTMEEIFFGLAPPKQRVKSQSEVHQEQRLPFSSFTSVLSDETGARTKKHSETMLKSTDTAGCSAPGVQLASNLEHKEAGLHAGGSPWAMPEKQWTPPPRPLAELRAMTSSDVREELERFFVRKDSHAKRFKSVETALLGQAAAEHGAGATAAAGVPGTAPPKDGSCSTFSKATREELLARDRCRRLVNVSNWDAAPRGHDKWDVLLPSALLEDCDVPPIKDEAEQAAPATVTSSDQQGASRTTSTSHARRTLRPHQVEGIRFLWSVLAEGPVGQVPAVGCILAHTMGLGKTAQVIVFLHLFMAAFPRRCERLALSSSSPSWRQARVLVVTPKSTQSGWRREFRTWSSSFPKEHHLCPIFFGEGLPVRQRIAIFHAWRRDGGVLVIGYEALVHLLRLVEEDNMLRAHSLGGNDTAKSTAHTLQRAMDLAMTSSLQKRDDEGGIAFGGDADPFTELVVCDEAHRLKSVHLNIVTALRGLHPLRRLLLTGTPLQNHLQEYWAMIDFSAHKYFNRRRFREYFIQPIEASANTRASEKEVDMARKKTFTLINEVRHFVQRVDSTPLRIELPPLHEYIVVVPPSPLQAELYRRFIQIVQHSGSEKLHFLPAVSYSGKIAAHPQLLFQMRNKSQAAGDTYTRSLTRAAGPGGRDAERSAFDRHVAGDLRPPQQQRQRQEVVKSMEGGTPAHTMSGGGGDDRTRVDEDEKKAVVIDSDADSISPTSGDGDECDERVFVRATQQSFSSAYPKASLTYEELCVPPSVNYTPLLEDGVKVLVAMKLVAAAIARDEKALLFSLSTQLLTLLEHMIAKVNIEWRKPAATSQPHHHPTLLRPIRYCRLDGSHSAAQRAAMLDDFDRPDGPDLFLLSMKAGGVGVTITAATRVILLDTSFNPADDQQAIGRAYRYGQTRPVYVYRLMCYPTLEYSIFVQKLAKEWLFKTVIEESSVKRDGLSGMHLCELFSLLTKASKLLEKPLSATRAQMQSTQEALNEDSMLRVAQADLLYAQRYEMFLEHDLDDQYGAAEEAFYDDYCRSRLFDIADDEDAENRRSTLLHQQRQQRMDEAVQIQVQSKTLTSMVDDIIRSRAGTDPNLARLLIAMGLHVDPITGRVHSKMNDASSKNPRFSGDNRRYMASSSQLGDSGERFAPSPVQVVGGPDTYGSNNRPQTATLLLDSDQDSCDNLAQPHTKEVNPGTVDPVTSNANSISRTLRRQLYARYRPGSSPAHAVDVDNHELQ